MMLKKVLKILIRVILAVIVFYIFFAITVSIRLEREIVKNENFSWEERYGTNNSSQNLRTEPEGRRTK